MSTTLSEPSVNRTPSENNAARICTSVRPSAVPDSFVQAIVYRAPGPYSLFVDEFSDFAADLATYSDNILLMGDFNIHVNNPSDALVKAFSD